MTAYLPAVSAAVIRLHRSIQRGFTPLAAELRQRWQLHVIIALVVAACYQHLLFNLTPSLPYVLAVLERGRRWSAAISSCFALRAARSAPT